MHQSFEHQRLLFDWLSWKGQDFYYILYNIEPITFKFYDYINLGGKFKEKKQKI